MEDVFALLYGEKNRICGVYFKKMIPICYGMVFLSSIAPFITALKMPLISIIAPAFSLIYLVLLTQYSSGPLGIVGLIKLFFYTISVWSIMYGAFLLKEFFRNISPPGSKHIKRS